MSEQIRRGTGRHACMRMSRTSKFRPTERAESPQPNETENRRVFLGLDRVTQSDSSCQILKGSEAVYAPSKVVSIIRASRCARTPEDKILVYDTFLAELGLNSNVYDEETNPNGVFSRAMYRDFFLQSPDQFGEYILQWVFSLHDGYYIAKKFSYGAPGPGTPNYLTEPQAAPAFSKAFMERVTLFDQERRRFVIQTGNGDALTRETVRIITEQVGDRFNVEEELFAKTYIPSLYGVDGETRGIRRPTPVLLQGYARLLTGNTIKEICKLCKPPLNPRTARSMYGEGSAVFSEKAIQFLFERRAGLADAKKKKAC